MVDAEEAQEKRFPQWLGIALLVLFLPVVLVFLLGYLAYGLLLHLVVWLWWLPRGKSVLVVTSDSPVWAQYMADRVVSALGQEAIVLNWSERSRWPKLPSVQVMAFRYFGRGREFNPLVVVFRPLRLARTFRFWKPFREYKHGSSEGVEALTERVLQYSGRQYVRAA